MRFINEPLISIVVPLHNESECVEAFYQELSRVCASLPYRFEFLLIDDGSSDETPRQLQELAESDPRVRPVLFSRNFGQQAALSAGIDLAIGDALIMLDGDLQHPPALIPELIVRWEAGFEIVNTIRKKTEGGPLLKEFCSRNFYRCFSWLTGVPLKPGMADFRLISRKVIDALLLFPERNRFLRGLIPWLGFRQSSVEFDAPSRFAGESKYHLVSNLKLALDGLISFGRFPTWSLLGTGSFLTVLALLLLVWEKTAIGLGSLILGIGLLVLAVVGEFGIRILAEVRNRPLYLLNAEVEERWPQEGKKRTSARLPEDFSR